MEHDFDYMKNLYIESPDKFKELTDRMIEDTINSARPESREHLRARQWRLQQELGNYKSPIARLNAMVAIFWDGVNDFKTVLSNPFESSPPSEDLEPSNIIEFKNKTQKS